MTNRGQFLTRKQVKSMIDEVDVNDDGEIDYSEFLVRTTSRDPITGQADHVPVDSVNLSNK